MSAPKTVPTGSSVDAFLAGNADPAKRVDAARLRDLMAEATGAEPAMWGSSIVGFGTHRYRYASGREGDTMVVGFAPRAQALTLYLTGGLDPHAAILSRLGKHTLGKGCLHLKRLADVDQDALADLVRAAVSNPSTTVVTFVHFLDNIDH